MQEQLSQKERMLLEDLKKEEDLCVIKYQNYAKQAQDPQLSQLFNKIADDEQRHHDTVKQFLQSGGRGQSDQASQGMQSALSQMEQSGGQWGQSEGLQQSQTSSRMNQTSQGAQSVQSGGRMSQADGRINLSQSGSGSGSDQYMLHDMLSTEKYVSSAYDTSVFESTQSNVRQALQQIQQEEQNHGEQLYQYMSSHGMYQVQ